MSGVSTYWRWFLGIAISSMNALTASYANAQIIPDATLPVNSNVRVQGGVFNITGGTQAGNNLFHSFQQFSVPTGGAALFNNSVLIQNIISRVTGGSVSNIDGLLRANGLANVFLINPNGVVFGPNASLNIGGSLAVSTANAIQFGEQGFFSATPANSPPLLTVNPSAFFFNQITPGNIVVQQGQTRGLSQVAAGRSLVLLGGDILVDGGTLNAQGGRVELGGLAKAGTVQINFNNNDFSLAFPPQVERADIQLSNGGTVNVIAGSSGSIAINARNLLLSQGSNLFAQVGNNLGTVDTQAGDITINTTGAIALTDNSAIASSVESDAIGNSGNINIQTGSFSLDNSRLFANTNGRGNAANISIQAVDSVALTNNSVIFNGVGFRGKGNGGNINIQADSLAVTNGSQISTSVRGLGDAGDININVLDEVLLAGVGSDQFRTGVFSNVAFTGAGNGGSITFRTGRLQVRDGAQVSTGTFGLGNAGNLSVETFGDVVLSGTSPDGRFASGFFTSIFPGGLGNGGDLRFISGGRLQVRDGAQVSTATFGQGNAGNLNFIARDAVELVGTSANGQFASRVTSAVEEGGLGNGGDLRFTTPRLQIRDGAQISTATSGSGNAGNLLVTALDAELIGTSPDGKFASGFTSAVEPGGLGNGGSLLINANRLRIANGAIASASSLGAGDPGSINAQADSIILNRGQLTAQSITSRGGDIRLSTDLLLLLRNSLLSTTFAIPQLVGNEEVNIDIDITGFFFALDNSNIIANAFAGPGANFRVNAQAFVISPDSSIVVNGRRFETPPIVELFTDLPMPEIIDTSTQITSSCSAFGKGGSSFTVTGRGGLPSSPDEPLSSDVVWSDTRLTATASQQQPKKPAAKRPSKVEAVAIVPATGWVFNNKGEVTLISDAANADSSSYTPATCLGH
ncbi:filamentous hemagglutinin family outer membrane protein [Tolypothrix sp. NIES-4075]|uniref:two-partner secretion domain-containing protein n=1 Tax=Tolypothrix sp. NIES-4075 TaxID=2005459 RepID=UPI000B75336F|nr:filamentous hemagglutinin N-terminal domain-containing protein [Tolypothrix sp. NIES-4075]GAX43924.1 filamentous hemagglutinin family outer membrane protein [Tolypothrix sp. NIES-4075]